MFTREELEQAAWRLYAFCDYPAVRYKILFQLLDRPYDDEALVRLRPSFLASDIVEELAREQDSYGGWGRLQSKDYGAKDKFPTSLTALRRCLYIGLTLEDRDILLRGEEYLEDFLKGTAHEKLRVTNERVIPWNRATVSCALEAIRPNHPLGDLAYGEWMYIASRAFEDGTYSYERERAAQHEVFWTREDRLVPMQTEFLLRRREQVPAYLKEAMLRHYGQQAYEHGYFWHNCPAELPAHFVNKTMRRWLPAFHYINQFDGSALFLAHAVEWLWSNRNGDGLWDWGTQVKDPWGYFGYFSTNRRYAYNRVVDGTMEILCFLKAYLERNPSR